MWSSSLLGQLDPASWQEFQLLSVVLGLGALWFMAGKIQ